MRQISTTVSRRHFLKTSGGVALYIGASGIFPQLVSCTNPKEIPPALEKHKISAWVFLSRDGQITIYNPAAEMGQGSMTSLPALFAEEMDADWSRVNVEFSPQEPEIYGSGGWGPDRKIMLSAGSKVTTGYYPIMRRAGAQARYLLLYSAAKHWDVAVEELSTDSGTVEYAKGNKSMGYGELVPYLQMPESLPEIAEEDLKNPAEYRFVGQFIPRTDIPAKADGSARFAIDLRLPDMVYGVLERGRLHGSRPTLKNEAEIAAMEGVLKIIPLEYAIGVIATKLESALEAKKQMNIEWSDAAASQFDSQNAFGKYEKIASGSKQGKVLIEKGNINNALRRAAKSYSIDFKNDYVYHAQMEPLNCIVQVAGDGNSAEVWVGSQQGFDAKLGIPKALGLSPEKVNIHLQYLGGGFGRRSMTDFTTECALLAREVAGRPLKLLWTREDDLRYGAYRPLTLQRLKAHTDSQGNITGFSHLVVGDGGHLVASGIKNEYYNIPNQFAEWREVSEGIRLKHWRAVGHGPNKFAIESMLDEIAFDQKIDPVSLRRRLMANAPRALATMEKAVEMADWNGPAIEGRAKGVAFLERSGTLSTGICEISVDRNTGKIRVHRFWNALDAGVIVQPDNVKAQMEGGIVMGMSSVLLEQITISEGKVQQSNFHDYQLLRMVDIPESIETEMIASREPPTGVGESGTPLVACAIANAFLKLTGKRLRHLPFTPERVLAVLNA